MVDNARYNEHSKPANAVEVITDMQAKADAGIIMGTALHCTASALYVLTRFFSNPGSVHVIRIIPQGETQKMDTRNVGYDQIRTAVQATHADETHVADTHAVEKLLEAAF